MITYYSSRWRFTPPLSSRAHWLPFGQTATAVLFSEQCAYTVLHAGAVWHLQAAVTAGTSGCK
jgi:hypothetical protein